MTSYTVTCETCLHQRTFPTREAATAEAEAHAQDRPDHTVIVRQDEEGEDAPPVAKPSGVCVKHVERGPGLNAAGPTHGRSLRVAHLCTPEPRRHGLLPL